MSSIILRHPANHLSPSFSDSWLWSWDPTRTLGAWLSGEPQSAGEDVAAHEAAFAPRFDVRESKTEYVLYADLPGVKPEAVEISLDGSQLKISGSREESHKEKTDRTYLTERSYGSFSRLFTLPEGVDGGQVHATLSDGVLTVAVPTKPEAQPRKIPVNASEGKA
jgi:HSP20 family protein